MIAPILGQEAICPDGLGRVVAFSDVFPHQWVQVQTYVEDRSCKWAPHNVQLVSITKEPKEPKEPKEFTMTLDQARIRAVELSYDCVQHICAKIRPVDSSKYEVDPEGYTISDWSDGTTVESYSHGKRTR